MGDWVITDHWSLLMDPTGTNKLQCCLSICLAFTRSQVIILDFVTPVVLYFFILDVVLPDIVTLFVVIPDFDIIFICIMSFVFNDTPVLEAPWCVEAS